MKWLPRIAVTLLLVLFLIPAVYYPPSATRLIAQVGARLNVSLLDLATELASAGIGVWAVLEYRRSGSRLRWLFLSTALALPVVWAGELLWLTIPGVEWFRYIVTALNYAWAILVCVALAVWSMRRHGKQQE